jgi:hypothetical protein
MNILILDVAIDVERSALGDVAKRKKSRRVKEKIFQKLRICLKNF